MNWILELFSVSSAIQALAVVALVCTVGMALGRIKIGGVSLGVAFVFFIGITVGALGLKVDTQTLKYAETFGLVIFVYSLGLHVGPNFFGSFRHEGMVLNLWSLAVIVIGTLMTIAMSFMTNIPMSDMVGILCGATTNTPALGAALQSLEHAGVSSGSAALATAVSYPLGVIGVIIAMIVIRKIMVRPADLTPRHAGDDDRTDVEQYRVVNPSLEGRTLGEVVRFTRARFIISRIWRNGRVIMPLGKTVLHIGDEILVVTNKDEANAMVLLFGQHVEKDWNGERIDWNNIDKDVESRMLQITNRAVNGKRIGELHLRETYGVNVSRVVRGDIRLLATCDLRLRYGDTIIIVGRPESINNAEKFLGNEVKRLGEPNIGSIFFGILLGLAVGIIPITLPGMDVPVRLGIAGGPIIVGIAIGALGPKMHFISYVTPSASLMLRGVGLALYLACLGLDAGQGFLETVFRPEGLLWIGLGFLITFLPVLIVGVITLRTRNYDWGTICGIICGSMANPMALNYASDTTPGDHASISYASVYPLGMFVRVIIAQLLVICFV